MYMDAQTRSASKLLHVFTFFGMQPTFTHVPPKPHVTPFGVGVTKSHTAT